MSILSQLLPPSNVLVDLDTKNVKKLFSLMSVFFHNRYGLDQEIIYQKLFFRERLGSTILSTGNFAMPNAVLKPLSEVLCSLVRLREPIVFDQFGSEVGLFLFVLVPQDSLDIAAEIYDELESLIREEESLATILQLKDSATLHQYVCHSDNDVI